MGKLADIANDIVDRQTKRAAVPFLITGVTIAEFNTGDRYLRIWSNVLNEEIIFAPDAVRPPPALTEHVVYYASELHHLLNTSPEHLRLIHETKKVFGAKIID